MTARNCPDLSRSLTRLSLRDLHAERVWQAMREHAHEIAHVRDVQRLVELRHLPGEVVAVAIADLVSRGLVTGACGAGRICAVEPTELDAAA